uniref:U3 small nucleolar RNA-associated protein 13 C-terminal domain-containing protein n=1 Tax=Romanomermis culicivorax TaxID=13658 RepID=A0A915KMD2_ROMCU
KLIGRNDEIYDLAFCGSIEQYAAVATNSSDVRMYDLSTSKCHLLSGAHSNAVLGLDVASWDKNLIVTCSKDNTLAVWRILDDKKIGKIQIQFLATGHAGSVSAVHFSRLKPATKTSAFIVSVSDDRTLKAWTLPSEIDSSSDLNQLNMDEIPRLTAPCTVVAHDKDIPALSVSPNDRFIASGSMDKTVKIWCVEQSKKILSVSLVATLKDHKRGVFDVKFSPVDQVIVTASGDFTLKIFALEDFSCIKTFEGHQAAVLQVSFVSNGAQLVSSDSMGLLKLWTIKTNECIKTLDGHEEKIYALCVDSTDDKLLTGGSDAKILCWKDGTENERALEESQKQEKIKNEQTLVNLMESGKFTQALKLSLRLSRPHDSYKIVEKILQQQDNDARLKKVLHSIPEDQTALLLSYVGEWNSNSRHYLVAQKVLKNIFELFTPDQLLKMPNIEQIVETLLPYSSRHFERLSRTKQQTFFVDYTWNCMRMSESLNLADKELIKREM